MLDAQGGLLGHKLGPLPVVVWVGLAGGAVAIAIAVRGKMGSSSSGGVNGAGIDMLAPSAAEAFGTLEEQQRQLTNALSSIGAGQAASENSLSDQITRNFANAANLSQAQYSQLVSGQMAIRGNDQASSDYADQAATYSTQYTPNLASLAYPAP